MFENQIKNAIIQQELSDLPKSSQKQRPIKQMPAIAVKSEISFDLMLEN